MYTMSRKDDRMMQVRAASLQGTLDLLHLHYHRNKNQHRRSSFWRWLSMLKRCAGKLVLELAVKNLCRSRARIKYMENILLPQCYV